MIRSFGSRATMWRSFWAAILILSACGAPQVKPVAKQVDDHVDTWLPRPEPATLGRVILPQVQSVTLNPPGASATTLNLHVVEQHDSPVVFLRWLIPGGRSLRGVAGQTPWPQGTLLITADLMAQGTKTHPGAAFADEIGRLGAELRVTVLADAVVVDAQVLSHQLPGLLPLIKELLTQAQLDKGALDTLKARYLAALRNEDSDAAAVAARLSRSLVFGPTHPYGQRGPTAASLGQIQRKQVLEAYQTSFHLGNTDLIVVGDVQLSAFSADIQALFASQLLTAAVAPRPEPPRETAAQACHVVDLTGAPQSAIIVAEQGFARSDARWPLLQVANQVLGGSASSRLFADLREKKGLTYGVYSAFEGLRAGGQWLVSTEVASAHVGDALAAIAEQLQTLRSTEPTPAELAAAKRYLSGQFAMSLATPDNVADLTVAGFLYGLPADSYEQMLARIDGATAADVQQAAQAGIGHAELTTVIVGDLAAARPALDARCPRLVLRDVSGAVTRVLIGSDSEMGDAGRLDAFSLWAHNASAIGALRHYVQDQSHAAVYRAQALALAAQGPLAGHVLELGRGAADWRVVAKDLWPLLTRVLKQAPLAAQAANWATDPQPSVRSVLLPMATDMAAGPTRSDLNDDDAISVQKAVADWAFVDVDTKADSAQVRALALHRLGDGDLLKLGPLVAPAAEHLLAADVRRHEAAQALIQVAMPEATHALLQGYRRLFASGVLPDAEDLRALATVHSPLAVLLLLDVHEVLEKSDDPKDVAATAGLMATIAGELDRLGRQSKLEPGQSDLATLYDSLEAHLQRLLGLRNADDRFLAARLLIKFGQTRGLRKVLTAMASDEHYRLGQFHKEDVKLELAQLAQEYVVPIGVDQARPHLLAALAGNLPMGKVIAIKALEAFGDDASVAALKTYGDETDVSPLLDLPGPFTLHEMAACAVDVLKLYREIDTAQQAGQLSADLGRQYKQFAFQSVDLADRRLRSELQQKAKEFQGNAPVEAPAAPAAAGHGRQDDKSAPGKANPTVP